MSTAHSCFQCSRPITVESLGGICTQCARAANTHHLAPDSPVSIPPRVGGFGRAVPPPHYAELPTEPSGTPPPRALFPPAPVGYELLKRLGSGGMGAVYLAREDASERVVAIKFLHNPGRPGAFERFFVELRAFAKLDHPNIVRVLASDFLRADPYFTMEHVPGGTLSNRLEETGPFDPAGAAQLIATVARAVHTAHAAGVVHRDLKPSNILLTDSGAPKVADFGLAKRTDRDDLITTASGPLGTPGYMAPEQVRGPSEAIGPTADVYGLGATLYHLITGRPPFTGDQPDILNGMLRNPPERPRVLRPSIPAGLEAIVMKCLEKKPDRRYPSAAELADDLDRFLVGKRPLAPELTWPRRAAQWLGRHHRGLAWAAAAVVVLATTAVFATGAALNRPPAPALAALIPKAPTTPVAPVVDEAAAIIKETTAGLTASLLKNNRPRHAKWLIGHGTEYPTKPGFPEFSFHPQLEDYASLELCPDPGVDSYRFSARLKHLESSGKGERGLPFRVGLFFGYEGRPDANGTTVHTFNQIFYSDSRRQVRLFGLLVAELSKPTRRDIEAMDRVLIGRGFNPMTSRKNPMGNSDCWLEPGPTLPGPWRTFEVEVTPHRVTIKCDGRVIAVREAKGFDSRTAFYNKFFADKVVNLPLPEWRPEVRLGYACTGRESP